LYTKTPFISAVKICVDYKRVFRNLEGGIRDGRVDGLQANPPYMELLKGYLGFPLTNNCCSAIKQKSNKPITIFVHQLLSVPSNEI